MHPLKNLITIDRSAGQPVYLQITNAFIHNIRKGRIRKGVKLPGSREMAQLLGINRSTMRIAYDELDARGWIERIPRKGTFVNRDLPDITPKPITRSDNQKSGSSLPEKPLFAFDSSPEKIYRATESSGTDQLVIDDGFPDLRHVPVEPLFRSMRSLSRRARFDQYLRYGDSQGTFVLRETLAAHLSDTRGLPVTLKNLMVTRGAQMGFYIAARLLIQPGDDVIVGEPGFFGANRTFERQGAVLNRVPVDDKGMDTDAVEEICWRKNVRFVYVIPHHHHPTTVTLTPERRIRLLDLAAKYKFAILEDDYDYDFHYTSSPMLPMASLDEHGSVIYIGTLAKTLAPGIRVGFMAGNASFIKAASSCRNAIDAQGDSLMEAAIAELYTDGTISGHIKKSVKLYRKRRDSFCQLLKEKLGDHIAFTIPDGGMSVWVKFNNVDLKDLSRNAEMKGLRISDGSIYNTHTINYNAARLGFASLNPEEQGRAMEILRGCVKEPSDF